MLKYCDLSFIEIHSSQTAELLPIARKVYQDFNKTKLGGGMGCLHLVGIGLTGLVMDLTCKVMKLRKRINPKNLPNCCPKTVNHCNFKRLVTFLLQIVVLK